MPLAEPVGLTAVAAGSHFRGLVAGELATHGAGAKPGAVGLRIAGTGPVGIRHLAATAAEWSHSSTHCCAHSRSDARAHRVRLGRRPGRAGRRADRKRNGRRPYADAEAQALYSRLVGTFTEVQAGVRLETEFGDGALRARPGLAVGLEALVPYFFEAEPVLFVSYTGDVSARFTGSYDLLVTQRFVLQPRVEANVALQRVADWGVGSGLNDVELGLRLRYEIRREVAPYVGVNWTNQFGGTADLTRAAGGDASQARLVFGVRLFR